MYRFLRNSHLFLGLFSCLFLLMYGVSSVQMSHNSWFRSRPDVTTAEYALSPNAADARAVARELMDAHKLRGEVTQVRATAGGLAISITRPGTVYQVEYATATGAARVRDNRAGVIGMLNRLHHVNGIRHDYWLINVWGAFVGIVSLFLFALGGTGIYLWFKIHQERVIGGILLIAGLGYGLTLLILVRTAW